MSSAVCSTSAAPSRPFVFDHENGAEVCPQPTGAELFGEARPPRKAVSASSAAFKDARLAGITPASRLSGRPMPEMVSSGIAEMDALTGGLPRGCLTEICGNASSGRSTLLLAALAAATRRGEYCAVVDASDALDPQSVADAGIALDRLLWIRCGENSSPVSHRSGKQSEQFSDQHRSKKPLPEKHSEKRLEQLMQVADLLLESGGFGMIVLDLGDIPPQHARRIPMATWFRFRRAVEHTPTVLLVIERQSIAGSCSSLLIKLGLVKLGLTKHGLIGRGMQRSSNEVGTDISPSGMPNHAQLLTEMNLTAELLRSRMDRKPVRSAEIIFASKTAWAG